MIISFSCRDVRKIFRIKYLFVFQSKRSRGTAVSKPTFNTPLPTIQRAYFTDTSPRSFLSQSVPRFLASCRDIEQHGTKLFQVQFTFLDFVLNHSSSKQLSWKGQETGSKEEKGKKQQNRQKYSGLQ